MILYGTVEGDIRFKQTLSIQGSISTKKVMVIEGNVINNGARTAPDYMGPYEVTPSEYEQVLLTEDKRMTANVVVHPIPSNWGRITWNGSYLTVS